uniref:Ig-like domain-containing protein n=1 Tax=Monodelphis domestica TaxID=13616 RepID=A0A5F8GE50_MONDO
LSDSFLPSVSRPPPWQALSESGAQSEPQRGPRPTSEIPCGGRARQTDVWAQECPDRLWGRLGSTPEPGDSSGIGVCQEETNIRQRVYHNGTMFFPNLLVNDSGYYEVQIIKDRWTLDRPEAGAPLKVYAPLSKPTISTSNIAPVENKDFSMTCQATGQNHTYQWFINNRAPSGSRLQLSPDKRTFTIRSVTRRENKGPYVCEIKNPFYSNRSDPLTLNVTYGPDTPVIVPTIDAYPIGANITLLCSAVSNPPAQFNWLYNGQQVSNSATFSTITFLSQSGTYTCHASNSFTGLQATKDMNITIYVRVIGKSSLPSLRAHTLSGGAIIGLVIGFLAVVVLIGALVYFLFIRTSSG